MAVAKSARRILALIHGWIGVIASLFIFLISATGLALAFMGEMTELQYGDMIRASDGPEVHVATLVEAAETARSDLEMVGLFMPNTRIKGVETALVFGGSSAVEHGPLIVSIDPSSAEYKVRMTF